MKPVITLDFETYYDKRYSLTRMNIPSYVSDPQFKVSGVAIRYPDGRVEFRTDVEALLRELRARYGKRLEGVWVVMHNAPFDYFVLYHHYGQELVNIVDTRLLSHLLDSPERSASLQSLAERLGLPAKGDIEFLDGVRQPSVVQMAELASYAKHDVELTYGVFSHFIEEALAVPNEVTIAAHTVRIFVERPFWIDLLKVEEGLTALSDTIESKLRAANLDRVSVSSDTKFRKLLEQALRRTGRAVPTKPGKNGPIPATAKNDPEMIKLAADSDPHVRALVELRLLVKSAPQLRKRLEHLRAAAVSGGGRAHFELVYHRSTHGRFAGAGGFNVQNLPVPDRYVIPELKPVAKCLREAIGSAPGKVLVATDANQIEPRVMGWLTGQRDLHDAFANGRDVYSEFAARVFGCDVHKPSPCESNAGRLNALRQVGKKAILGLGYGMGVERFMGSLQEDKLCLSLFEEGVLDERVCARLVHGFRDKYSHIHNAWKACDRAFRDALNGSPTYIGLLSFRKRSSDVCLKLPSGREMVFADARLAPASPEPRTYLDANGHRQEFTPTDGEISFGNNRRLYGGAIVEYVVSGTARDILVHTIIQVEKAGFQVISHCHDEIICEVEADRAEECREAIEEAWQNVPTWAAGLVLESESSIGTNYAEIK
jgi:DNA polymerase I-like protein with 3'-5' exonuclease and polymerase domains